MKWWIVVLVLGVLLTASGTGIGRNDGGPGEITCGSEAMRPGDVCEETQRGVVTETYTYAEKVQDEKESAAAFAKTGRWVQLGLGGGMVLIGAVGIVLTKRRRARQPTTTADLYLRHQQAMGPPRPAQPAHTPYPRPFPPPQHHQPPCPQQQYPAPPHQQRYPDFGPRG